MMLWFAAALGMSFAVEAYFAPGLFASPIYAPLAPHLGVFALVSGVTGVAALAAAEMPVARVARAGLAACAAVMPLSLAVTLVLSGSVNGTATWGLLSLAMVATAALSAAGRSSRWVSPRTTAGTLVLVQGLLMLVNPRGFSLASYGAFTEWLWLWGPLFVVCGAGLLAGERLASRRVVLAFTAPVALCLEVLVITFLGTGIWSGVTIYGILLVFLGIDAPGRPGLRRLPTLLLLVIGGFALYHLGAGLLDMLRGPGPEAWDLLHDFALLMVAGAWLSHVARPRSAKPAVASVLAVLAAAAGVAAMVAEPEAHPAVLGAGGHAVGGRLATDILLAGFSATLLVDQRWPRHAWVATVVVSIAAVGLSLGLDSVVASMLNLAEAPAPALSGGRDAFDSAVLVGLSLAVGVVGATRALEAPIGGRILAAFSAVVLVAVVRSLVADVATEDLLELPRGSPEAAAVAARLGATRGVLLLVVIGAAALSSVLITATVARPLAQLMATLRRYTGGDRSARAGIAGTDELGTLARTFDDFAETVEVAETRQQGLLTSLIEERQHLRSVVESALEAFVGMDAAGRIVDWNSRAEVLFGWSRSEIIGRPVGETIVPAILRESHARGLRRFLASGEGPMLDKTTRVPALHRDGHAFSAEISVTAVRRGDDVTFSAFIRDISDQERREAELENLALHDALTDLPNRTLLKDRWQLALAAAWRDGTRVAVALVDLDQFRTVNDALGHAAGDALLREVGQRFRAAVRENDTVARLGGDEFAVVVAALVQESEATEVAGRMLSGLARPIVVDGQPIYLTASAGLTIVPVSDASFEEAMRQAEVAMYEAKRRGGGELVLYSAVSDADRPATLALSGELRAAIGSDELWVAYQPIVEVASGRCLGLEALARWEHPQRGSIPPAEFIPLAERSGIIRSLGLWVLGRALADLVRWRSAGNPASLSVNVSMRQLGDASFVDVLLTTLGNLGLPPSALTVEVTESALMGEASRVIGELNRLRAAGVRVSIDDFGTGYSSLAHLHDLPIDEVKIDRSLVADAVTSERAAVILRAASALTKAMALSFVAEGVEDEPTWAFLGPLGGVRAQGDFIGHPMRAEALPAWLATHQERVAGGLGLRAGRRPAARRGASRR